MTVLRKALFQIEVRECLGLPPVEGWTDGSVDGLGWAMPYFDWPHMGDVTRNLTLADVGIEAGWDPWENAFEFRFGPEPWEAFKFYGTPMRCEDGRQRNLYQAANMIWEEVGE